MSDETEARPVRAMHDFFEELGREWDRFKLGAIGGTIASGILLVFALRILIIDLRILRFRRSFFDLLNVSFSFILFFGLRDPDSLSIFLG